MSVVPCAKASASDYGQIRAAKCSETLRLTEIFSIVKKAWPAVSPGPGFFMFLSILVKFNFSGLHIIHAANNSNLLIIYHLLQN